MQLKQGEPLPAGLRRVALAQIDAAITYLTTEEPDAETAVHEARKCGKRIRAVLRLVRDEIGYDTYKRENVRVRDAARLLAPVRDSTVMVEALDALLTHFAQTDQAVAPDTFAPLRRRLADRHARLTTQVLHDEDAPAAARAMLLAARVQVAHWPITDDTFAGISGGLHRVYRRGRTRMARAYAQPSPERFHDWRKRVKYLWHQMEILTPIQPQTLTTLADELHTLSSLLGDDHDLAELDHLIDAEPDLLPEPALRQTLAALIAQRRRRLQDEAQPLGARLYAQTPPDFVAQLAAWWAAWRAETPPIATDPNPQPLPADAALLSTRQVAQALNLTPADVRARIEAGALPAVKIGRYWYVVNGDGSAATGLLTTAQAAAALAITPAQVRALIRSGELPGQQVDRHWLLPQTAVAAYPGRPSGNS